MVLVVGEYDGDCSVVAVVVAGDSMVDVWRGQGEDGP